MAEVSERESWRRAERRRLIAHRLALAPEERQRCAAAIGKNLTELLAKLSGATVGFYWPIRGEFDPLPVAERFGKAGRVIALPAAIAPDAALEYRPWRAGDAMEAGRHSIPEPRERRLVQPDILVVPLVGFDQGRHRLGYGGGYFDRTLAALSPRPVTIGVGYEAALLPTIYPQAHDVALDFIVTEAQLRP
ncbi:MAG TPA: 5-formyltetrahydrofolate cyclo-ligase [Stellaceae bacterium]|nr:5-formyltetrahydrofolate cyclo-ligase [Stellaceae bacterium]